MIWADLTAEALDTVDCVRRAQSPAAGGVVTFEGTTRNSGAGAEITALEYEAYERRASVQLFEIAHEAVNRWSLQSAVIVHRVGVVSVGEPGVVVVTAAAHRAEAFDACRWIIDTLKEEVAIWKREIYADGTSAWLGLPPSVLRR